MATDLISPVSSRKAWGVSATATLAVLAMAAWGSRGPWDSAVSAQSNRVTEIGESGLASSAGRSSAVALARLLPASGLISVGARPGMRVVELKVKEDDQVAAGTVLALLEGHESARLQLKTAEAQKRRGEHERTARLTAARKAAETSKRRLDEGRTLYNQFSATLKGKDRYDAEMALYQVEMQAIKAQLDLDLIQGEASRSLSQNREGEAPSEPRTAVSPARTEPRPPRNSPSGTDSETPAGKAAEKKQPADVSLEETILEKQVELAAAALRETEVRAPGPGRVLRVLAHPGELSSGALLVLGDVSSMVAKAEVYQSDIPRIRPGDPAEVEILGTKVAGKVTRIGSIVGKNQLTSIDPRALRDRRIVEVTIQLDEAAPADRFVDMEVEAVIRPSGPAGETTNSAAETSRRTPG